MEIPFHLIDVFADRPLTGNPLAVVPHADKLDDRVMQSIARELNQAETTFLLGPTQISADWQLRSFTAAGVEVFGAGHNSLGAWWWLAESGQLSLKESQTTFTIEQGYEKKRPSLLSVQVRGDSVRLSGRCVTTVSGTLRTS